MTLDEARSHIGDGVIYRPAHGETEEGTITSVNDRFVFVRYGARRTSAATEPAALTLLAIWDGSCAPGGYVCARPVPGNPDGICGMPVESEPCPEHEPDDITCGQADEPGEDGTR